MNKQMQIHATRGNCMNKRFQKYAPIVLRLGIAFVFLWFGISQLVNPDSFVGYVPQFIYPHEVGMVHEHPLQMIHNISIPSLQFLIIGNGILETIFGILLLGGLFTRTSAAILAVHLFIITLGLGYNDIAIRDFGLVLATVSIFMRGADNWSLDTIIKKRRHKHE